MLSIFDDLYRLNREMNRVLYGKEKSKSYYWPEVNVYNNENEYVLVARIPGIEKDDISISLKDNSLKLTGEKKSINGENLNYHLRERKNGKFERNILFDEKIDSEKINAEIKNGLLLIKLSKSPETKPVKIEIK